MIPPGLLFQVDPIYTFFHIEWWDFLVLALIALVLTLFTKLRSRIGVRKTGTISPSRIPMPEGDDRDFERKVALIIRNRIGSGVTYPDAYTARELAPRKGDHPLLPILRDLEAREYRGESLSEGERKRLIEMLRKN